MAKAYCDRLQGVLTDNESKNYINLVHKLIPDLKNLPDFGLYWICWQFWMSKIVVRE